jgi:hypothetical protein
MSMNKKQFLYSDNNNNYYCYYYRNRMNESLFASESQELPSHNILCLRQCDKSIE